MIMIGVYIGYAGFFKPLRNKIISAEMEIQTAQRRLEKNMKLIQKSKGVERQYKEYFSRFKQSKTDEQVMASMLSEIEGVAGELGLRISELKPKKAKKEKYYNKFSVSLKIDGSLTNVLHFLHRLQGVPHLFDVEEVRFDKRLQRKSAAVKTQLVLGKMFIP